MKSGVAIGPIFSLTETKRRNVHFYGPLEHVTENIPKFTQFGNPLASPDGKSTCFLPQF